MNTALKTALLADNGLPFSPTLNKLISDAFELLFNDRSNKINVDFVPFEPYGSFEAMSFDITNNKHLSVSLLHSDCTIFGSPAVNAMFRAVHDYFHHLHNLNFEYESELIVNYHQHAYFRKLGANHEQLDLLQIETAGQIVYHKVQGDFPDNQRLFAVNELEKMGY